MHSDDKYTLKPVVKEKFKGIIWKIEIDATSGMIALETRDQENHTANYSALNFVSGKWLFKEVSVENSWLWSLDKVQNKLIFLHSYLTEQSPEHVGIIALNERGGIEWQHHNRTLQAVAKDGLITFNPKIQPKFLELLSAETGNVLKSNIKDYKEVYQEVFIPDILSDPSSLPSFIPQNIVGPVYFLSHSQKECYAYHVQVGEKFIQELIIAEGNTILTQTNLTTNIQKLNPEAFFISRGYLFCIRDEKREIVSYLL